MTPAETRDRTLSAEADLPAAFGGEPVFKQAFRFIKPTMPPLDTVLDIYRSAYEDKLLTNGDIVSRFESAAAERLGVRHCVAVSSCTSGLMLVFRAFGLKGEVIVPSFTFFASGHAIAWNQLTPVFADIDAKSWTVNAEDVERLITPRTSAILAVHMYGNPCDVERLEAIAAKRGVKLVFDAAHAFGSRHNDRPVGQFGDAEVFSLSPTKLLVTGEGGLVATNDSTLAHRLRAGRNYGDLGAYDPEVLGMNARMSEFNAALGLAGLDLLDGKLKRHNQIAHSYTEGLSRAPGVAFQHVREHDTHTYKDYSVLIDPEVFGLSRDELAHALKAENIETKKYFYPPLHQQALYQRFYDPSRQGLTQTERVSGHVLSLPIYESLPDAVIEGITHAVMRLASHRS